MLFRYQNFLPQNSGRCCHGKTLVLGAMQECGPRRRAGMGRLVAPGVVQEWGDWWPPASCRNGESGGPRRRAGMFLGRVFGKGVVAPDLCRNVEKNSSSEKMQETPSSRRTVVDGRLPIVLFVLKLASRSSRKVYGRSCTRNDYY